MTLTAGLGLSPGDEFFLWGLLALTLAERDGGIEFWATPHYCLRRLGCIDDATKKGGGNYESFRQAIGRLAAVTYPSDAFFDPVRSEHRHVAFGLLSRALRRRFPIGSWAVEDVAGRLNRRPATAAAPEWQVSDLGPGRQTVDLLEDLLSEIAADVSDGWGQGSRPE